MGVGRAAHIIIIRVASTLLGLAGVAGAHRLVPIWHSFNFIQHAIQIRWFSGNNYSLIAHMLVVRMAWQMRKVRRIVISKNKIATKLLIMV